MIMFSISGILLDKRYLNLSPTLQNEVCLDILTPIIIIIPTLCLATKAQPKLKWPHVGQS